MFIGKNHLKFKSIASNKTTVQTQETFKAGVLYTLTRFRKDLPT